LAHITVRFTGQVIFLHFFFVVVISLAVVLHCTFRRVSLLSLHIYIYIYIFFLRGDEFPLCFHSGWCLFIVLYFVGFSSFGWLVGTLYVCFFGGGGGGGGWQAVQYSPLFQFAEKRGPQRYWKVVVQCTTAINGFLQLADTHT
jgi:hypothetical protein